MENEEENEVNKFLGWAAKLGITDSPLNFNHQSPHFSCLGHSLCVSHFPDAGGRGLAATRDLRKGELILRVPKQALFTTQSVVLQHHNFSLALQKHQSLSSTQILTIALLHEISRGKNSTWFPYLKHFPQSYDILASFSQLETQALQVDYAIWAAEKAIGKAKSEWKEAVLMMNDLKIKNKFQSLRAWLWASGTISSRTLHIPWDEAGCLCPVGDLFNYAAPGEELGESDDLLTQGNASCMSTSSCRVTDKPVAEHCDDSVRLTDGGYEKDMGSYCFYARNSYRKGEQVLLSYGTYTNLELLEHYGFILNRNPNEMVFIPLEPEMYSCCSWSQNSLFIHQNGKPSFTLLSTIRLWATPPNQRKSVGHIALSGSQISKENELFTMEWIAKKCHFILKNFGTTIKEDNLLLAYIDNMRVSKSNIEFEKMPSTIKCEIQGFLNVVDVPVGEMVELYRQSKNSVDRWKLAVEWRVRYKKILVDCISHCIGRIDDING
ncbi:protein SET DOMAIN GROUP 40 [Apium graveolens]|uniref:protein SET DOMAIN GROUP 40 n=1 Tax=Apium graveolens TaxID=4045 RepID=UPI003D78CAC3